MLGGSCSPCCANACICTLWSAHIVQLTKFFPNANENAPPEPALQKIYGTYILRLETPSPVPISFAWGDCANYLYEGSAAGDADISLTLKNEFTAPLGQFGGSLITSEFFTVTYGGTSYTMRLAHRPFNFVLSASYCNSGGTPPAASFSPDFGSGGFNVFIAGNIPVGTLAYSVY